MDSTGDKAFSGIRILCVDDSPESLEILIAILNKEGASITACVCAETAIEKLEHERFDLVITDLSMPPGLDGYDIVHALRKIEVQNPSRDATPTIAVSSDALRPSNKRRFSDFQVYMPKPVDIESLIHFAERLVTANGEAVKRGSLANWEAQEATKAAIDGADFAARLTLAASQKTIEAIEATAAAAKVTASALRASMQASHAEQKAQLDSQSAPD